MRSLGNVAPDKAAKQCKTSMGNGRAAEKALGRRLIHEDIEPLRSNCGPGKFSDGKPVLMTSIGERLRRRTIS